MNRILFVTEMIRRPLDGAKGERESTPYTLWGLRDQYEAVNDGVKFQKMYKELLPLG